MKNYTYRKFNTNILNGTLANVLDVSGDKEWRLIPLTGDYTFNDDHEKVTDLTNEVGGDAVRAVIAGVDIEEDGKKTFLTTTSEIIDVSADAQITFQQLALAYFDAAGDANGYLVNLYDFESSQTGTQVEIEQTTPGGARYICKLDAKVVDFS